MARKRDSEPKSLKAIETLWGCIRHGAKRAWKDKFFHGLNLIAIVSITLGAFYEHMIFKSQLLGFETYLSPFWYRFFLAIPWGVYFLLSVVLLVMLWLIVLGVKDYKLLQEFQKKIELTGLRGSDGSFVKVIAVNAPDEFKTQIVVKSVGLGLGKYQARKDDLESSFAQEIDSIVTGQNPQIVIINLTKRKLPKLVTFNELEHCLIKPQTFLVGESMTGAVTRTLESLPHMLIAGTTGGGKSVFFKQMLLGLLKTTPNLQLYLLDLKRGVEMKDFSLLPNAQVAKNESEAVNMLQALKDEMERRFSYMEEKGLKQIDPQEDKMDKIVVGIDEASVIYTKTRGNSSLTHKARELTDDLAKLARATGIHLILATQKVSKETIDTKVQENIGGRVCFKMNTMVNSITVLGNKMAYDLPDIRGRAVWASGNQFTEIQAPFMSDEQLKEEIDLINDEFREEKRKLYGKMLPIKQARNEKGGTINLKSSSKT